MKKLLFLAVALICYSWATAQQNEIKLTSQYGAKNKEVFELMRFQGIESNLLTFSGKELKGKNYTLLLKEYTNGVLSKTDTLIDSKSVSFIPKIQTDSLKMKFFFKTENDNVVKMHIKFPQFTVEKKYEVKKQDSEYALHDFLGSKPFLPIKIGYSTYALGYFLPYELPDGGKSYCDVSGSKYKPEKWGEKLNIPNYFLIQVLFE